MATKISICSNALVLLGDRPISSFSEGGEAGTAASNLYDSAYESELVKHRWRFATKKSVSLSRFTDTPQNEWAYQFQLPTDLLLVQRIYPNQAYEIYGDRLYSNMLEAEIDYTYKPDETSLPGYFAELMELKMAWKLATPVTDNATKAREYSDLYQDAFTIAALVDSQQSPSESVDDSPLIDVRG